MSEQISNGMPFITSSRGLSQVLRVRSSLRAEAQVLRLSCLYALLDNSAVIRAEHQQAGLALWEYSEQSVMAIFGDLTGDPNVDTAKEALRAKGELTLTELHGLFGRHATSAEIERVIAVLVKTGWR